MVAENYGNLEEWILRRRNLMPFEMFPADRNNSQREGKRKYGGVRHEARICGRSSPDSLAFSACESRRRGEKDWLEYSVNLITEHGFSQPSFEAMF